jgi:hypothetical protein
MTLEVVAVSTKLIALKNAPNVKSAAIPMSIASRGLDEKGRR